MTKQRISIIFILLLIGIQFIKPQRNAGIAAGDKDITHTVSVPPAVLSILEKSCYDCHSNHSNYVWYFDIQPVGWWLQNHINEGKGELNFSEFGNYSAKKQKHKLKEITKQLREQEMPLSSYTLVHTDTKINSTQIELVANWASEEFQKISLE